MSEYQEFTGKTVEEALRLAREAFSAELNDLDFEILTPGSRGVLGMGAEPARIVAAPRAALGGAAPKREAKVTTGALSGLEIEAGDKENTGIVRIFVALERAFVLRAAGPRLSAAAPEVQAFFGSFKRQAK